MASGALGKREQVTDELQLARAQPFELAEDISFDFAAEELNGRDVVDGEQCEELRELDGGNAFAGFERTERLLPESRRERGFFLRETGHAAQFAQFEYEIQLRYLLSQRTCRLSVGFVFGRSHGVRGDRCLRGLLRLRCLFLCRVDRAIRGLHEIDAGELQHVAIQLPLGFFNGVYPIADQEIDEEGALLGIGHRRDPLRKDAVAVLLELLDRAFEPMTADHFFDTPVLEKDRDLEEKFDPAARRKLHAPELYCEFAAHRRVPDLLETRGRAAGGVAVTGLLRLLFGERMAGGDERRPDVFRRVELPHAAILQCEDHLQLLAAAEEFLVLAALRIVYAHPFEVDDLLAAHFVAPDEGEGTFHLIT